MAPLGRDDRLPLLAEIRVAVNSPDTFANFGAKGYPIFAAVRLGTCQSWPRTSGWIAKPVGALVTPGRGKMYLRAPVYIAETDWQARDEPEESIMHFYRWLGDRLEVSATWPGARAIEQRAERGQRLQTITYEGALRDKVVVGTPERVTDRLQALRGALPARDSDGNEVRQPDCASEGDEIAAAALR